MTFGALGGFLRTPKNPPGYGPVHAKFRLDPSNRLATVHERHKQTDRTDRQRTDNIGRTVLQTVAQKLNQLV